MGHQRWGGWIAAGLALCANICGSAAAAGGSSAEGSATCEAGLQAYYARYGYPSTAGGERAYKSAIAAAKAYADRPALQAYYAKHGYPSTAGGERAYKSAIDAAKAYAESYVPPPAGCGPAR
jgi:hypothetical protein